MKPKEKRAYLVVMLDHDSQQVVPNEWLRQQIDVRAQNSFESVIVIPSAVVDLRGIELSGKAKEVRNLVFENIQKGNIDAVVLCGNVMTEFGTRLIDSARRHQLAIYLAGFGQGILGRQFRAWHGRAAERRRSRKDVGTWQAVDYAHKSGINIC